MGTFSWPISGLGTGIFGGGKGLGNLVTSGKVSRASGLINPKILGVPPELEERGLNRIFNLWLNFHSQEFFHPGIHFSLGFTFPQKGFGSNFGS